MATLKKGLLDAQESFIEDFLGRPQCDYCKHFIGTNRCQAFPKGIPLEIASNRVMHDTPYKGQKNKIVFEEV